jgi:nucleoside phosphorylase/tetratricopeptide (TPR) repeat protein
LTEGSTCGSGKPQATVVVLTALSSEFEAVESHLAGDLVLRTLDGGTIYTVGTYAGRHIDWSVAVAEIGAGNEGAGIEATAAVAGFEPSLLMFAGVAGSLKPDDAPRGTVVVADKVYGYEYGKDSDSFRPRPEVYPLAHRLSQLARAVRSSAWKAEREIGVVIGAVAAGDAVVGFSGSGIYERIRDHFGDAVAVEMESLGLYMAAHRANALPVLSVRGISDCVDDKTAAADAMWQPKAAANAAEFAFAMLDAIRPDDVKTHVPPSADLDESQMAALPFSCGELLEKAAAARPVEAAQLLSLLAGAKLNPRVHIESIVATPPQWLLDAESALLWASVAELAKSHGLHAAAADAYAKGAAAGGARDPWAVLSALSLRDSEGPATSLKALEGVTAESPALPVALARAAVDEDSHTILEFTDGTGGREGWQGIFRLQALQVEERVPEAIELAEEMIDELPRAAGMMLVLAKLYVRAADEGMSPLGCDASLIRARELALTAKDLREAWGGDTVEPVILAAKVSLMLGDSAAALRVTSSHPEGTASKLEADSEGVRRVRIDALMLSGRGEDALSEAGLLADATRRHIAQAQCLTALGRPERAKELLQDAVSALAPQPLDDPDSLKALVDAVSGLAHLGVSPPPGLERLEEASPDAARRARLISAVAQGDIRTALRHADRSQLADVGFLATAMAEHGQVDDAVILFEEAATRFHRSECLLDIVRFLQRAERFEEAYDRAVAALAVIPDESSVKPRLRRAAIENAALSDDYDAVVQQARAAISAGDGSETTRWALVIALNNTLDLEGALAEATGEPALRPRDSKEAGLLVSLNCASGAGPESVAALLNVAEAYPESEEVVAAVFMGVVLAFKDVKLGEDLRERFSRVSDAFFERFPNSAFVKRIEATPQSITDAVRALGESRDESALEEVANQVAAGRLPLAFLADTTGKSQVELLVKGGIGGIVGESRDGDVRMRERQAAAHALGRTVVLDASAVHGAILTGFPDELLGLFPQSTASAASVQDGINASRQLALRSTASMGWDSRACTPVIVEVTTEDADRWAVQASAIESVLRSSRARRPSGGEEVVQQMPLTLEAVQVAKELGLPLYSDDCAVRALAAHEGVETFGTISLLDAAVRSGAVDVEEAKEAMDSLRRASYVDLDWTPDDLVRVAESESLRPTGGVAWALARPAFWTAVQATRGYGALMARLAESGESLEGWQNAATYGLLGAVAQSSQVAAAASLLALAFTACALDPSTLPVLLQGARHGASARGVADPLSDFCRGLARQLTRALGEAQGGKLYAEAVKDLAPEDRAIAVRELLIREEGRNPSEPGHA